VSAWFLYYNLSTPRVAQGEVRSHSPSKSSAADPGYLIRDFSCPKRSSTSPALGKQNPQAGKRSRHQLLFRTGNAIRYPRVPASHRRTIMNGSAGPFENADCVGLY